MASGRNEQQPADHKGYKTAGDQMNKEFCTEKLPQIQGIDVVKGLDYVGGDISLYRRLLLRFIEDYGDHNPCIGASSLKDLSGDACRFVHSMKGLAGTLGATAVQEKAAALENALHENDFGRTDLIDAFNSELAQLIIAIRSEASLFNDIKDESNPVGWAPEGQADRSGGESSIAATIANLIECLQKRQPRQSRQYLEEIAGIRWSEGILMDLSIAAGELKQYRFDEVLSIIRNAKPLMEQHILEMNRQNEI